MVNVIFIVIIVIIVIAIPSWPCCSAPSAVVAERYHHDSCQQHSSFMATLSYLYWLQVNRMCCKEVFCISETLLIQVLLFTHS